MSEGGQQSGTNPAWQATLDRYYAELNRGGIKTSVVEKDLWSTATPDDLIAQIEPFAPTEESAAKAWAQFVARLRPILLGLNDFVAVVSWSLGMNNRIAAVLWGSLRLIIKFSQPALLDLVDMLEGLQRALPRTPNYEQGLAMTETLGRAFIDMYNEIIVFCAHSMTFFRNNPNVHRSKPAWSQFSLDFEKVIVNLRDYSKRVDEAGDLVRLSRESYTAETVAAIRDVRNPKLADVNLPCHTIPYGMNLKFFGREKDVERLSQGLRASNGTEAMRVVAIHGLGGVGKTQLALHYANTSLQVYDVIAWIPAESQTKIVKALSDFSSKLGLSDPGEDDSLSVQKVRDWLNSFTAPLLLIFDNVEDAGVLEQIWPVNKHASVIVTTRSPSTASERATNVLPLECFDQVKGSEVLIALTGIRPSSSKDEAAASELSRLLGGLPLGLNQMSSFMVDRGCSYEELTGMYNKSIEKILNKLKAPLQYSYTLGTAWDKSIERLSTNTKVLHNLLAFFDPDFILERVLKETKAKSLDSSLQFLLNDFDFGDAVMELNKASLARRIASSRALSVHRFVQLVAFNRLSASEKQFYFDAVIQVLYFDFSHTWDNTGPSNERRSKAWGACSPILPHVSWLMSLSERHNLDPINTELWAELIVRAGTYLRENEQPSLARSFFEFGLCLNVQNFPKILFQAFVLLGHIFLDLAQPHAALQAYQRLLAFVREIEKGETPRVAGVYNCIANSYTEMGHVSIALDYLAKATAIRHSHDQRHMSHTETIKAMAYLRAGQPIEALDALRRCWELKNLTQEQIATSQHPRHCRDIVLLARIHLALGNERDGQQLAERALSIRRGTSGQNRGPRVADSLFMISKIHQDRGEAQASAELLREVIAISKDAVEMRGHLARALWFLAAAEEKIGTDESEWKELKRRANEEKSKITSKEEAEVDSDEEYMRLVSWMLW